MLLHGFPQTSYQFRLVITPLADAGYTIVVPDYRGAGGSSKALIGYTKDIMARDLHTLITKELGISDKIHLVGYDIGGMIAHAYAVQYPEHTASVCWGDCVLPGSAAYHERKNSLLAWHYSFHSVPELPELLVAGRERIYLKHFYDRLSQNPAAISTHDLDVYADAYAQPGALRCAFDCYRTLEEDAAINDAWVKERGKSSVPCMTLWGAKSYATSESATAMARTYYQSAEYVGIKGSGHWIAEEKPKEFTEAVLSWVQKV